jgi:CheY-like chemotaxis protein
MIPRGSGRILVMDDEEIIRDVADGILSRLGYEVECASNGKRTEFQKSSSAHRFSSFWEWALPYLILL